MSSNLDSNGSAKKDFPSVNANAQASDPVELGNDTVRFDFSGTITTGSPVKLQYRWIRSDGSNGPLQTLEFTQAGTKQACPTSWQLSKGKQAAQLWEAIEIIQPHSLTSNHANITVPAKSIPVTVIVTIQNPGLFWGQSFLGWNGSGADTPKEVNVGISNLSTPTVSLLMGATLSPGHNTLQLDALVVPGTKIQAFYQVYGATRMILRIDSSNQDTINQAKTYNFTIIPPSPEKLGGGQSSN